MNFHVCVDFLLYWIFRNELVSQAWDYYSNPTMDIHSYAQGAQVDGVITDFSEHGFSKKATEQMDVYSFGVVLLELISGRQAGLLDYRDPVDVVKWVRRKINMTNGIVQVLDQKISNSVQREMLGGSGSRALLHFCHAREMAHDV